MNIYEESKQTVNFYADGWQSCLNASKKVVVDAFIALTSATHAASDATSVPVPESHEGHVSQGHVCAEFKLNGTSDSSRAGLEPKSP